MKYLLLFMISFTTFASERPHEVVVKEIHTIETRIEPKLEYRGIATAIATAQHSFNWGTKAWQGSIGTGHYNASNALSFGMGKRYGRMLFNGSIGSESGTDKYSFGAGVNWQF